MRCRMLMCSRHWRGILMRNISIGSPISHVAVGLLDCNKTDTSFSMHPYNKIPYTGIWTSRAYRYTHTKFT